MLYSFKEYQLIVDFYGDQKAQRSQVPLINHINEGLVILNAIAANKTAQKAYCLHPILQNDEALVQNFRANFEGIAPQVMIATIEYRSVANSYLSQHKTQAIDDIRLSPLPEVNNMLIADKVQNRKDFELYHQNTHPRSEKLAKYFQQWLRRLGVSEEQYQNLVKLIA
ncbi:MAG TPA: hypothetical protein DCS93_24210 [Microscillaceae bacterium]|nr:hypothetical protein [Microscillaceae bacterium]